MELTTAQNIAIGMSYFASFWLSVILFKRLIGYVVELVDLLTKDDDTWNTSSLL